MHRRSWEDFSTTSAPIRYSEQVLDPCSPRVQRARTVGRVPGGRCAERTSCALGALQAGRVPEEPGPASGNDAALGCDHVKC